MGSHLSILAAFTIAAANASGCNVTGADGRPLRIATAASLVNPMTEIAAEFTRDRGEPVVVVPGSSGNLAVQIREGAPFDVFAAADEAFVDQTVHEGSASAASKRIYARGRLVAWTGRDSGRPLADLAELADPRRGRIALAHPDYAPYGRAAREALQAAGVWPALAHRVVYATNVRQAWQFADSGNAGVAFTALTVALATGGAYLEVDPRLYTPLAAAVAICKSSPVPEQARAFVDFLTSPRAAEILARHGLAPADM